MTISVILDSANYDGWDSMKMGMEQSAKDFKTELHIVNNQAAIYNPMDLMERERRTSNVIITDLELGSADLQNIRKQLPIVTISNKNRQESALSITIPNQQMGQAIGALIHNTVEQVYIVLPDVVSNHIQERKQGILDVCHQMITEIAESDISEDMFSENRAIIALDTMTMEKIINHIPDNFSTNSDYFLYGIGYSNSLLPALESDMITTLVVPQDYNVGYTSIEMAVNAVQHKPIKQVTISFALIDSSTIYKKENEALLFPFIQ